MLGKLSKRNGFSLKGYLSAKEKKRKSLKVRKRRKRRL